MFKINRIALSAASLLGLLVLSSSCASLASSFSYNHPRRAEVLRRDTILNREINHDYGRLTGHYGRLEREDRSIRWQEQRDARLNGGFITPGEQRHLNHEENRLQRQINRDY
jgi:hypothetical protein